MPTDPAEIAKIITIAPGLCVRQAIDNIAWIDMGEYAIVVDGLEEAHLEDEVFAAIAATLGDKPIRYVINTHTHYDHVALNAAFVRRCGARIINFQTQEIPAESSAESSPQAGSTEDSPQADSAEDSSQGGLWFRSSRRGAHLMHMPGCHTEEDLVLWVEPERVLFTGDIFGWGLIPLIVNLREDTAKLLTETYNKLIEMDPATVVPGHGPLCTKAELSRWLEYFQWLRTEIIAACQQGRSDEEILDSIKAPADMHHWWRFLKWKHKDSVAKVLKSVRKGWIKD